MADMPWHAGFLGGGYTSSWLAGLSVCTGHLGATRGWTTAFMPRLSVWTKHLGVYPGIVARRGMQEVPGSVSSPRVAAEQRCATALDPGQTDRQYQCN